MFTISIGTRVFKSYSIFGSFPFPLTLGFLNIPHQIISPFLCQSQEGRDLSWLFTVRNCMLLEVKPTKVLGSYSVSNYLSNLPCKCSYQFMVLAGKQISVVTLRICLSLQISRREFALLHKFFNGSQKIHWLSVYSAFSCSKGQEWQPPNSSYVAAETRSP